MLKHAEGSPVRVVLEYRKDSLTIRVTNDPPPRTGPGIPGSGAGLAGLGERLSLLGGKLAARPLGDGGFGVIAVIPLDEVPWDSRLPGEDE